MKCLCVGDMKNVDVIMASHLHLSVHSSMSLALTLAMSLAPRISTRASLTKTLLPSQWPAAPATCSYQHIIRHNNNPYAPEKIYFRSGEYREYRWKLWHREQNRRPMQTSATATAELNNLENKWRKFNANYAAIIKFYLSRDKVSRWLDIKTEWK